MLIKTAIKQVNKMPITYNNELCTLNNLERTHMYYEITERTNLSTGVYNNIFNRKQFR
jgi:hypothetical protein